MPFQTIPLTERDAYSPITQELLKKYYDRDEQRRAQYVPLTDATGSGGPGGPTIFVTYRVYVPIWASRLAVKINGDYDGAGTNPFILWDLNGLGGDLWVPPAIAEDHTIEGTVLSTKGVEHNMRILGDITGAGSTIKLNAVYGMWWFL